MDVPRNRVLAWTLVAAAAIVIGGAWYYFAPKPSDTRAEPVPAESMMISLGSFTGADSVHHVSGSVELLRDDAGYLLHFEDYEATAGPDVYFYLAKSGTVDGDAIRIPTDAGTGQATLRGAFNVRVPDGVDATQYSGLAVWCDRFGVLFGHASLA